MVCHLDIKQSKEAKDTESYKGEGKKTKAVGRGRRQGPKEQEWGWVGGGRVVQGTVGRGFEEDRRCK